MDSREYWVKRLSDPEMLDRLPRYNEIYMAKIDRINKILRRYKCKTVMDLGCGLGWTSSKLKAKEIYALDIVPAALEYCNRNWPNLKTGLIPEALDEIESVDAAISLDVIYHLVEDEYFEEYLEQLFSKPTKLVMILSSDTDEQLAGGANHIKHRKFTDYVEKRFPKWHLDQVYKNDFPWEPGKDIKQFAFADYFCFVPVEEE